MGQRLMKIREDHAEANVSIWKEALFAAELLLLHTSPVYYGLGIPHGDGSAVVVVPGFLGTDTYLAQLHSWLERIGYRPYFSGIGVNAHCPNLLIEYRINENINKALQDTGRKIHIIGHSLGGIIARSIAAQYPNDIASVITLGSPIRGTVLHRSVLRAAEAVRERILETQGENVLPACYTGRCTCNFINSLRRKLPKSIVQTAVYTKHDGVVDWRYCLTGDKGSDFEVSGTHVGLTFNALVYSIVANRLAQAHTDK
jgi:triacylglycerol lipase